MKSRPVLTVFLAILVFVITMTIGVITNDQLKTSVMNWFGEKPEALEASFFDPLLRIDPEDLKADQAYVLDENVHLGKTGQWSYCLYEAPEDPAYNVEFVSVEVDTDIRGGDVFTVDITMKNTGNARLFSNDAGCGDVPVLNLGTQYEQDRSSDFGGNFNKISGWISSQRVKMQEEYADPGEELHFVFQSLAPEGDDIYREFFQPVVERVAWVGDVVYADIEVGEPTESMYDNIGFAYNLSVAASELEGLDRSLEVDLSDQMMFAKIGGIAVWQFQVSTGAYKTPTPTGDYKILNKQELRIGGAYPHYRMPYWQGFRIDGYGLHALPYLANDGGAFWSEALDHIGIPVSHGCVRQLSDDAKRLYEFTNIGTPLNVRY